MRRLAAVMAVVTILALAPHSSAAPQRFGPEVILVRLVEGATQRVIQDSKWGFIGRLQVALNARAADWGLTPVEVDGRYGAETAEAVRAAAVRLGVVDAARSEAHLTSAAFEAIVGAPPPTALERARALTRTLEGTDYDALEWNVCSSYKGDQGSVLTWGPYGKTLGWGGELMDVLKGADRAVLDAAFKAEGAKGLDRLLALKSVEGARHRYPGARALMQGVCAQKGQKAAWERAFARLGAEPAIRDLYDAEAWGEGSWFRKVVGKLEDAWWAAGLEPTEVDFAFFLDRAIHMGWGNARFDAVERTLMELRASLPPGEFTNARARFAVADAVRPAGHVEDRLARDAIFLVDAEDELAAAMDASPTWPRAWKTAWRLRANISAADAGLSDARPSPGFNPPTPQIHAMGYRLGYR